MDEAYPRHSPLERFAGEVFKLVVRSHGRPVDRVA